MVPHRGTNWAALWLTAQIRRDAVLSESYGRRHLLSQEVPYIDQWDMEGGLHRVGLTFSWGCLCAQRRVPQSSFFF